MPKVPGNKKATRQMEHVYKKARARGASEESAAKQGWGAVKKSYKKNSKTKKWVRKKKKGKA